MFQTKYTPIARGFDEHMVRVVAPFLIVTLFDSWNLSDTPPCTVLYSGNLSRQGYFQGCESAYTHVAACCTAGSPDTDEAYVCPSPKNNSWGGQGRPDKTIIRYSIYSIETKRLRPKFKPGGRPVFDRYVCPSPKNQSWGSSKTVIKSPSKASRSVLFATACFKLRILNCVF